MDTILREILLSFWKVHILHHAAEGPVYGQWIMAELRRHGYEISPGTLYPLLQRMETGGYLTCEEVPSAGPRPRKNYRIAPAGLAALAQIRLQIEELHREVVQEGRDIQPEILPGNVTDETES